MLLFFLIIAPPVIIYGARYYGKLQKSKKEEAIAQIERETYTNRKNACKLEQKLTVFKKIPKGSGILFNVSENDSDGDISIEDNHNIRKGLKEFAKPAFLEWQTEEGKYSRRLHKDGAILAEIKVAKKRWDDVEKLTIEETFSQYIFNVAEITTVEDKQKRIKRFSMTLKNKENNELLANYISFYSNRSYFEDGCLDVNYPDVENDSFHYFFSQVLDETQTELLPITDKNKDPQFKSMGYEAVGAFHGDLAVVLKNGKKSFINDQGEIVIPPNFQDITRFIEKRVIFRAGEKWGVINTQGDIIAPAIYDLIRPFANGLAYVKKQDKWGLMNHEGQLVLPTKYKEIKAFKDGFAKVEYGKYGSLSGMVNSQGKLIIPVIYEFVHDIEHGLITVGNDGKSGLLDIEGNVVMPMEFESIQVLSAYLVKVQNGANWNIYNTKTGKIFLPDVYDEVYVRHGLINVRKGEKKGLIDAKGNFVIPMKFSYIDIIDINGADMSLADVKKGDYWGIYNVKTGKEIIPAIYDSVSYKTEYEVFIVIKDKKNGLINTKGDFILPMDFDSIQIIDANHVKVLEGSHWGVYSTKTWKEIVPISYDNIKFFKHTPNVIETHKDGQRKVFNIETGTPVLVERNG